MKSLAITGIGTVCPLGNSPEELFAGLEAHRHGFVEVPLAELPDCRCRFAARVTEFDSSRFIPPLRARRLDRASLFALGAAHQAISASRLDDPEPLGERMGVVLGTSSAGAGPVTAFLRPLFAQSPEAAPPFEFPNTVANAPASYISIELKLQGPNTTLAHKQSAMAPVLLYTSLLLEDGRAEAFLVGATDEWNPYYHAGYDHLAALRRRAEPLHGEGMLLGEGATLLVVESEAAANNRGIRPLALVRGVSVASSPGRTYRWVGDAAAMARAILSALAAAGCDREDVGSLVLAANGVSVMEQAEAAALAELFAGRMLPATGVKGALGECAASGAAALAVAALARQLDRLPPYPGGVLAHWPDAVAPLATSAPLPSGVTLVLLYGAGGNFGALVVA